MKKKKTVSSSTVRRGDALSKHRRPRISYFKVLSYILSGIGDKLYYLGATVERRIKNTLRHVRHGYRKFFGAIFAVFKGIFGYIGRAIKNAWNDIVMPFKKLRRSFKSLSVVVKSTEDRGRKYKRERVRLFFKYGWLWNKHLISRLANYLFPLVSFAVCVIVISTMLNLNYALRIDYNGQTVGYVSNESVYDSARKLIQNKMVNDDQSAWENDTTMGITIVDETQLSSQDIMAEHLLEASGEIDSATGVYIGGMFYGATKAPDLLEDLFEEIKAPYVAANAELEDPDITVKFARDVELKSGVFPVASILAYDTIVTNITNQTPMTIYYNATAGEVAVDIARINGIPLSKLQELNPNIDLSLPVDTSLVVAENEVLLRVKAVKIEVLYETIAYETTVIKDENFTSQQSFPRVQGQEGERRVTMEYEYVDGVKVAELELSNEITKKPVNQEVVIGTKDAGGGNGVGTGTFVWPTAAGYRVSRGFAGSHFGIDIAAPQGTHIYAADDGVVVYTAVTNVGYGVWIQVDHQNGYETVYAHNTVNLVEVGQTVTRGQLIAYMGSTGNSTGDHLHFEVRLMGVKVDPAPYIGYTGPVTGE